jgi:hypothetical protein
METPDRQSNIVKIRQTVHPPPTPEEGLLRAVVWRSVVKRGNTRINHLARNAIWRTWGDGPILQQEHDSLPEGSATNQSRDVLEDCGIIIKRNDMIL